MKPISPPLRRGARFVVDECAGGVEGVHENCCCHELPKKHRFYPAQICCHCGTAWHVENRAAPCGQYEPGISMTEFKKREIQADKDDKFMKRKSPPRAKWKKKGRRWIRA